MTSFLNLPCTRGDLLAVLSSVATDFATMHHGGIRGANQLRRELCDRWAKADAKLAGAGSETPPPAADTVAAITQLQSQVHDMATALDAVIASEAQVETVLTALFAEIQVASGHLADLAAAAAGGARIDPAAVQAAVDHNAAVAASIQVALSGLTKADQAAVPPIAAAAPAVSAVPSVEPVAAAAAPVDAPPAP